MEVRFINNICDKCGKTIKKREMKVGCYDTEYSSWWEIDGEYGEQHNLYKYIPSAPTYLFCIKCSSNPDDIMKFRETQKRLKNAEMDLFKYSNVLNNLTNPEWIKKETEKANLKIKQAKTYK